MAPWTADDSHESERQSLLDRTVDSPPPAERPGKTIGRYRLLERIGEGGFGVVYMAEQQYPVRRRVALKVIKAGMDSRQVVARFEAERQALAIMDHANIAKVLDAGATDSGRPYFVMELVPGVSITDFCDGNKVPTRERLGMFVQVCQAVQHAHTKGVIHRDLKPGNVLVTVQDDRPVPKVIDFGVAKAAGQQLTERTLFTQFAQMVGTPLYMSPEQAQMGGVDVDTRSDVYSLGVLLYELLTGSTPFDRQRLGEAALDEVRRIIREEEPPRPSTRLSTAAAAPSLAAGRGPELRRLSRLVRGELDWIVMKCLEKDRGRRYETVAGLGLDLGRYLTGDAVQACPPSAAYRARKFARKHTVGVAAALAVTSALLLGMTGTGIGMIRATSAQHTAQASAHSADEQRGAAERARDEATRARTATEREAGRARAAEFITAVFLDAAASPGSAHEGSPRALLAEADRLGAIRFGDGSEMRAFVRHRVGCEYLERWMADDAEAYLRAAAAYFEERYGPADPQSAESSYRLGLALQAQGRPGDAEPYLRRAADGAENTLGRSHHTTQQFRRALADALVHTRRLAEARPMLLETLPARVDELGTRVTSAGFEAGKLVEPLVSADVMVEAERYCHAEVAKAPEGTARAAALSYLIGLIRSRGERPAGAESFYRAAVKGYRDAPEAENAAALNVTRDLGALLDSTGQEESAGRAYEDLVAERTSRFGKDHPATLLARDAAVGHLERAGRWEAAIEQRAALLEDEKRVLGARHVYVWLSERALAQSMAAAGRRDEAVRLIQMAQSGARTVLGENNQIVSGIGKEAAAMREPARAFIGTVMMVQGRVEVRGGDGEPWTHVQVGAKLGEAAAIRTGLRSTVTIDMGGDRTLTVEPRSQNSLLQLRLIAASSPPDARESGEVELGIEAGGVEQMTTLRTPSSVIRVRG